MLYKLEPRKGDAFFFFFFQYPKEKFCVGFEGFGVDTKRVMECFFSYFPWMNVDRTWKIVLLVLSS